MAASGEKQKKEPAYGAWVVIVGVLAIVCVFVPALLHYKQASEVATATAGVSGVIAALVGAYFGVRGATLSQQQGVQPGDGEKPGNGKASKP